jgi:MFS family permease
MDTTLDKLNAKPALRRARIAISLVFLILGAGAGIWAVHIPLVASRLAIDPAVLGLGLLTMAAGAVSFMILAGLAIARFGSRRATAAVAITFAVVAPLPIVAPDLVFFFIGCLLFGAAMGSTDVAMNTQASELEALRRTPIMSSFHGFYSAGALGGALIGAAVIGAGWGNGSGALAAAVILLAGALYAARGLLRSPPPRHAGPSFALPNRAVVGIGLIAFLCFAIEGAVTDWSALYLSTDRAATPTMAATGFALFSVAMAVCRLAGDPVVARLGGRAVLVGGGILMLVGVALALAAPNALLSAVGFGLIGIGAANTVPVVFSAAGQTPGVPPSVGIAAVTTFGYTGFLVAPPILGFLAKGYGLSASIMAILVMSAAVIAGSLATKLR